jgi:hypothetical protein
MIEHDSPEFDPDLAKRRREERRAVEHDLIENASHGDQHTPARIMRDAQGNEELTDSVYGEADEEHLTD